MSRSVERGSVNSSQGNNEKNNREERNNSDDVENPSQIKDSILILLEQLPLSEKVSLVVEQLKQIMDTEEGAATVRASETHLEIDILDREIDNRTLLPVNEIAELTGYSAQNLRSLLRRGKIRGEKREPKVVSGWFTSLDEVERYMREKPSQNEWGLKGARKRWHDDV